MLQALPLPLQAADGVGDFFGSLHLRCQRCAALRFECQGEYRNSMARLFADCFREDGDKVPRLRRDPCAFSDPRLALGDPAIIEPPCGDPPPIDPGPEARGTAGGAAYRRLRSGPFDPADPGRPPKRVRASTPRDSTARANETYGGLLRVDPATGRRVLVEPGTGKPVVTSHGRMVCDPPITDILFFALAHRLRGNQSVRCFTQFLKYAPFFDTVGVP